MLALAALLLLIAVSAQTDKLIPLYAIGVFIGFTLSQIGLVRHWRAERPSRWRLRVGINGAGAAMTAVAVVVLLATKFLAGAWVVRAAARGGAQGPLRRDRRDPDLQAARLTSGRGPAVGGGSVTS